MVKAEYYPESEPLPQVYVKQPPPPCPYCRAIKLENGRQATVLWCGSSDQLARFKCRVCGGKWKLPVIISDLKVTPSTAA